MPDDLRSLRVDIDHERGVAEVTLLGPGKGNALGPDFWAECPGVFRALDKNDAVRAVIVRGGGGAFTYGLDLKAMMPALGPDLGGDALARARSRLLEKVAELQASFDAIEACRKPVIAAIAGWCIGGGVDLVAACDVRLASADAKFSVREVRVAMVADLGSLQRLPRIVGQGHARELALTGKDIDAARAARIGLVNDVYPSEDELLAAARAMACAIADNPPLVVQGVKQVMNYGDGKSVADGQRFVAVWNSAFLASNDLFEAVAAFAQRRPPKFTGS
jgi:enoyl-CoA hydratase